MDKPLTERDFDLDNIKKDISWNDYNNNLKRKVQSAKRLLKQRTRCFLLPRVTALFHKEIDACFQIDDGKGEE